MNERYPNLKQTFGLFGIYLLCALALGMVMPIKGSLAILITTLVINTVTILVALNFKKANWNFLWSDHRRFSLKIIPICILCVVSLILILDPLVELIPMPQIMEDLFNEMIQKDVWTFLSLAVLAPVSEEFLFRRIIFSGLKKNYGLKKAILWSAFIFALFHFNPWQGIGAFCLGVLFAWIYHHSRNIWIPIILHSFNNSLAFILLVVFDDSVSSIVEVTGYSYQLAIIVLLSVICLYLCIRYLHNYFSKTTCREDQEETEPHRLSET